MKNNIVHTEKADFRKVKVIDFMAFLMGFSQAILAYVMSTYFKEAFHTENVGIFYLFAYVVILFSLLSLHKLVKKFGKSFLFQVSFAVKIVAIVFLIVLPPSIPGAFFLVLYIISGALAWTTLDVILESFSVDKMSGRIRGFHLVMLNLGFILGPLLSSRVLGDFGFSGIFLISLFMHILVFVIALVNLRGTNHRFKRNVTIVELIKKTIKRRNVMRVYYISFVLDFFYALMVIYAPLYLLSRGFSWDQLGVAFTIMLIPFILIQYPAGILADKKMGEKELLFLAAIIMGGATLVFYLTDSSSIFVWAAVLFVSRIGAALIEILRESYFFKRIDGDDVEVIDFFRSAKAIAYISATAMSSIIILLFSIREVFILVAIVVFSALWPILKLEDNKGEVEVKNI